MRQILLIQLLFAGCFGNAYSQDQQPFALVELFTSEGCGTCPPAEKLLSELKADAESKNQHVFFLEYHVDYWNRLGWKDPYSSFQFTNRQKNYTSVLNEESMYTPMMVVDGKTAFTGSDRVKARSSIDAAMALPRTHTLSVKIDSLTNDTMYVGYRVSRTDKNYYIRAAVTEDNLSSSVSKGENAGKTLSHDAVVRAFHSAGVTESGRLKIPLKKFSPDRNCKLIVFIQHKQTMEVFSVASVSVTR